MAATNPYLMKDLIKKYGWEIQPYLSSLGTSLLSNGQVLFVDSGHADALDADDTVHGHRIDTPLATIDYAVGLCTADQGDVILVAPGHTEDVDEASGIDFDVSDITVIGLGVRSNRPVITFSETASTIQVNAANVTLKNLQFVGTKTGGVTVAIDIQAAANYLLIEDCRFYETANTLELLTVMTITDEADYITVKNCMFENLCGGDNLTCIINEDDTDFLVVEGCTFIGDWTNSILDLDTSGTINYPLIKDCLMVNHDATAGLAVTLNAGTKAVIVGCNVATAKGTYPTSDTSASYEMACSGSEPGSIGYAGLTSQTAANFSA